jgi:hypothetical protein
MRIFPSQQAPEATFRCVTLNDDKIVVVRKRRQRMPDRIPLSGS